MVVTLARMGVYSSSATEFLYSNAAKDRQIKYLYIGIETSKERMKHTLGQCSQNYLAQIYL